MKKLGITFLKDMKLAFNGLYFYIEIGMAVIFILIMLFVVPENFDKRQTVVAVIPESYPLLEEPMSLNGFELVTVENKAQLEEALKEDATKIGLIIGLENSKPTMEFVMQGYEGDALKNLLKGVIEGQMKSVTASTLLSFNSNTLSQSSGKLSDRSNLLPVYLTMNVALMGLFIIAAYIYLDKDEGVIKAYAVAPVSIWQYLASKILVMNVVGVVTSVLVVVAVHGLSMHFIALCLMVLIYNTFGSCLGLWVSSYFNSMTKAMGAMYLCIMILLMPAISYSIPSFDPSFLKWLPTHPMLYTFRSILLNQEGLMSMLYEFGLFLLASILFFALANKRYKKTLTV